MADKTIAIVAVPGVQLLDVSGPLDVFAEANLQVSQPCYRLVVVGAEKGPVRSSSGVRLLPDWTIDDAGPDRIDTLIVAGCPNAADISPPSTLVAWLRRVAQRTRRYGSVCSGAFLLAATGSLTGAMSPLIGRSPINSPRRFPKSGLSPMRSMSAMDRSALPRASPPVSISPWLLSRRIWGGTWR